MLMGPYAGFFKAKTVFHDRSRSRIGFAPVDVEVACSPDSEPATRSSIDRFGANSLPTPGVGCQRGTGSGGGCNIRSGLAGSGGMAQAAQSAAEAAQRAPPHRHGWWMHGRR